VRQASRSPPKSGWTGSRRRRAAPSWRVRDMRGVWRRHPAEERTTRPARWGFADYRGEVALQGRAAGRLHPRCTAQPDNMTETLSTSRGTSTAWRAPELDEARGRKRGWSGAHRGARAATRRLRRAGRLRDEYGFGPAMLVKLGWPRARGSSGACNVPSAAWVNHRGGCPKSAASAWPARCPASRQLTCRSGTRTLGRRCSGRHEVQLRADRAQYMRKAGTFSGSSTSSRSGARRAPRHDGYAKSRW